jgi:hypothetical protein
MEDTMAQHHQRFQNTVFDVNQIAFKTKVEGKLRKQEKFFERSISPTNRIVNYSILIKRKDKELEERSKMQMQ